MSHDINGYTASYYDLYHYKYDCKNTYDGYETINDHVITLFRDRFVTFILYILSFIVALLVGETIMEYVKEKRDTKRINKLLIFIIIAVGLLILFIGFFAWIFRCIKF